MKKHKKLCNGTFNQGLLSVVVGIIIMMCLGTVYSWSIFRIYIEELYNISTSQSGFPYMVSLAFYALFMFLTGKHIDKYKPRIIISIGGILTGIGWILSSYASNIFFLTITYGIIMGAGVGIAYGVPMTVVAKWFPKKKGFMVGLVLIGFGLSPFITAPIASYLVISFGVMEAFRILGISFLIALLSLSCLMDYPSEPEHLDNNSKKDLVENNKTTKEMIKTKSFKCIYFNFVFGTMIGLMIVGITNNVGVELINLPSNKVSFLMPIFAAFNGIGRPLFGWFTDKISNKKAMLLSYTLIIFAAILMLLSKEGNVILYIIAFSIFWFNLGGWLAIAPASTLSLYGIKNYSQNYGFMFTAYGFGAIISVYSSGKLLQVFQSYNSIFYLTVCICILGIVLSQSMLKTNKESSKVQVNSTP